MMDQWTYQTSAQIVDRMQHEGDTVDEFSEGATVAIETIIDIIARQNQTGLHVVDLSCPRPRPVWFRLTLELQ